MTTEACIQSTAQRVSITLQPAAKKLDATPTLGLPRLSYLTAATVIWTLSGASSMDEEMEYKRGSSGRRQASSFGTNSADRCWPE